MALCSLPLEIYNCVTLISYLSLGVQRYVSIGGVFLGILQSLVDSFDIAYEFYSLII